MAFALTLPGTEPSISLGSLRPYACAGKAFVYPGREQGSFAVASPH